MSKASKSTIMTADGRARNFACVVYPESAPSNWLDTIAELKIPVFVSPLHDKDFNPKDPETGIAEPKKPHYHVMACYEGKKSLDQAKADFEKFGGVGCEVVSSLRGYARYLCHLDNPEKAQYSVDDVKAFGGADFVTAIGLPTDKYKAIREMIEWCKSEDIVLYSDLLEFASVNRSDWFRVLCDNGTVVIMSYLKSRQYEKDKAEEQRRYEQNHREKLAYDELCDNLQMVGEICDGDGVIKKEVSEND